MHYGRLPSHLVRGAGHDTTNASGLLGWRPAVRTLMTLTLPEMPSFVTPIVYAVPMQLIAYHTAVIMGTDVDKPRNLAKSVTVE